MSAFTRMGHAQGPKAIGGQDEKRVGHAARAHERRDAEGVRACVCAVCVCSCLARVADAKQVSTHKHL